MKTFLPGTLVNTISVFDLRPGMEVFDKASNTAGVIVNITETNYEEVEALVKLEGWTTVVRSGRLPKLVLT